MKINKKIIFLHKYILYYNNRLEIKKKYSNQSQPIDLSLNKAKAIKVGWVWIC